MKRSAAAVAGGLALVLVMVLMTVTSSASATVLACLPDSVDVVGVVPEAANLDAEQQANARVIVEVTVQRKLPSRAAEIAIATAMQESTLHNLAYGDRDSLGLFQQRPSQGWGTPAQLLDPVYATNKFLDGLQAVPDWPVLPLTVAAQTVQRSAYPDAYAKWEPMAIAVVAGLLGRGEAAPVTGWMPTFRSQFTSLAGVSASQSPRDRNDQVRPGDSTNEELQAPTLKSNVETVADPEASDGRALAVHTRMGTYQTSRGAVRGWTNGRMNVAAAKGAPPVRVRARVKFTPSRWTKAAVMWWPSGNRHWRWEVDFAETFGDKPEWWPRQQVAQRWHGDTNGDGRAKEQIAHTDRLDATRYHLYDLTILPNRMSVAIDGVVTFSTTDRDYIPDDAGEFSVGKALEGLRSTGDRTPDAVLVDWVEVYRPGTGSTGDDAQTVTDTPGLLVLGDDLTGAFAGNWPATYHGGPVLIDAAAGRTTGEGLTALKAREDAVPGTVLVSLGAHDGVTADTRAAFTGRVKAILDTAGADRTVYWLTSPFRSGAVMNGALRALAETDKRLQLIDVAAAVEDNPEWIGPDDRLSAAGADGVSALVLELVGADGSGDPTLSAGGEGCGDGLGGYSTVPVADCEFTLPKSNPRVCEDAVRWALAQVDGPAVWYRRCLNFVARSYGYSASGVPTAYDFWLSAEDKHVGDTNPPAGALVFWETSAPAGHVALSAGNGMVISNDIGGPGTITVVSLAELTTRWNATYLGWAPPSFPLGA